MPFELDNNNQIYVPVQTNLSIARGDWNDLSHINKFGFNANVGSTFETIWDGSSVYSYPATAGTIQLTSSNSAADNGGTVQVVGLDENYVDVSETLTIGGDRGTQQFIRVFRMIMLTANTGTANVGTITATHTQSDSTDTAVAIISAGLGQTLMTTYTVPANYQAYIVRFYATVDVKDKQATVIGVARPGGTGAFQTKSYFTSNGNTIDYSFPIPLKFPQKTDFEVRAKSPNGVGISATYDIILEKTN